MKGRLFSVHVAEISQILYNAKVVILRPVTGNKSTSQSVNRS